MALEATDAVVDIASERIGSMSMVSESQHILFVLDRNLTGLLIRVHLGSHSKVLGNRVRENIRATFFLRFAGVLVESSCLRQRPAWPSRQPISMLACVGNEFVSVDFFRASGDDSRQPALGTHVASAS